ncbi:RagB/SusD family nutrient uptake outer membrane protein [Aureibaculum marinum]|uniref:RagB/SusD family nutrient uptake outer membrane protein n=1 Tax=Aureibaculum marinum TaxID=2487930 RepID=A0A3N4NIU0_9FLAO|nr:RagB/SusD family nutrient uptake outer membrane protein [Aureibaculum marinum]RPD96141.1 RagB/SusD family nutrient uptake outer membrane protein [Aureibaculum marinum]
MKKIILYISLVLFSISCQLTDVLENDPPNNLVPENVVSDETDANALINGIYATITSRTNAYYYMYTETIPGGLAGTMSTGFGSINGQFNDNDVKYDNIFVNNYWTIFNTVIDHANNAIAVIEEFPENEFEAYSKTELIGEARYLRAMATFDALRYFGQFFDLNSSLGIILRNDPVNFVNKDMPRSSVAECYSRILDDLDFAIENAPDFTVTYRASKTSAKTLKAKVLLYQGKYDEVVTLTDEIISDATRDLAPDYETVFSKGLDSEEMIFMTYRDETTDIDNNNRKRYYTGRKLTGWYTDLMIDDPREPYLFNGTLIAKTNNEDTFRPTYFLRLAQVYLMKAEALAFNGATLEEIAEPLNIIRNRAEIGDSEATSIDEIKDDIFYEIARELGFENGSVWFAAIRFGKIMDIKPTVTSSNQYILPFPESELLNNGALSLADQNPGYE